MSDDRSVKGFVDGGMGFGPSDHPEVREMPFRVMAVGDFRGVSRDDSGPVAIDAHDFDAVMARLKPRAVFEVPDHLGGGKALEIDLTVTSLKDFEPRNLAECVPALRPVADFIRRLRGLSDGGLKPGDFKRDLSAFSGIPALKTLLEAALDKLGGAPAPGASDAAEDAIAGIFSMVDTGAKKGGDADSGVKSFVQSLGGSGGKGIDLSAELASAEALLAKQLAPVLARPEIRRLERNWRGLHLLCRRGKAVKIELFDAPDDAPFDAWQERAYQAEYAGTSEAPLGLVVLAADVPNTPAGLETLQQFGDAGGEIQCPVVFEVSAEFLGLEDIPALARLDAPAGLFDDSRFDKWRSLREKEAARWLAAALNPWLARAPWSKRKHGLDEPEPCRASPAWLVAASVAGSMERTGWPASHTGAQDGEVEQLTTLEHADGAEYPLAALLSDRHLKELTRAGLTPLIAQPNHDSAWVILAPTLRLPSRAEEEGKLGTLAYQLLAARLGEAVIRAKPKLIVPGDMAATVANFEKFLAGLLAATGPGAAVIAAPQGEILGLAVRTGWDVLGGVELQLGVKVGP